MRIKLMTACAVVSFTLLSAVAGAQSAPTAAPARTTGTAATVEPLTKADVVTVPVWPKIATKLPETQEPVATSFALGQIEGIKPELVAGVTANGYARQVAVENQKIGQVLVLSVAKDGKEEAIASEGLSAQFDATETSQLFPEKNITVEGSKAALTAALEKLAAADKKDDEKKEVKDATSENAVGSNASGNDLASSYKTPPATTIKAEKEPTITVSTSTDGCSVRVDLAQEKAFVQSKEQTFSDGVLSAETQCSDSEVSYPLKKSYLACPDIVSLKDMTAWPQFTWYYADGSGETHTVSECTKDEELPYTIAEDEGQCTILTDFAAGQAVPQSALVYTNRNGAIVQARGCDTSTLSAAVPMTESTAACPLRHDHAAGLSHELSMWTYQRNGVTYQAAPCADTGRTFTQEKVYTDSANEYVCTPIVNQTGGTVTLQSRKRITIDGISQYITECTPDTATQAILSTTDGCMDPSKWTHDIEANVSYGQERFYFLKGGSTPVYVTNCQTSAVNYAHSQTVTGYQPHDDQLFAYPLTTVKISVNGSPYTIKSSEVLPGATQFQYTLSGTVDKQNGAATYEGCNAFYTTTRYEQWARPDRTVYEKAIGDGAPVGPSDVCSTTQESATYWQVSYSPVTGTSFQQYVSRTVRTNPNTGEVFIGNATNTGTASYQSLSLGDDRGGYASTLFFGAGNTGGGEGGTSTFGHTVTPAGYSEATTPCKTSQIVVVSQSGSGVPSYWNGSYVLRCGYSPATAAGWK